MWIKIAVQEVGPLTLVAFRTLFGLLFGVTVILVQRVQLPRSLKAWTPVLILGVTNVAIPFFLISWGEQSIDSAVAAILGQKLPQIGCLRQGHEKSFFAASLPGAFRTLGCHYYNATWANRGRSVQTNIRRRATGLIQIHVLRRIDLRDHDVVRMLDRDFVNRSCGGDQRVMHRDRITRLHGDCPALSIEHDIDDKLQPDRFSGVPHELLKGIAVDLSQAHAGMMRMRWVHAGTRGSLRGIDVGSALRGKPAV